MRKKVRNLGDLLARPNGRACRLVIHSLRDIHADCKCGHWTMLGRADKEETDADLESRIQSLYDKHKGDKHAG